MGMGLRRFGNPDFGCEVRKGWPKIVPTENRTYLNKNT
jgi:hypothetical protein